MKEPDLYHDDNEYVFMDAYGELEQQLKEANDLLSQYSDKTMGNITFPEFDNVRVEMIRKYGKYLSKYGVN